MPKSNSVNGVAVVNIFPNGHCRWVAILRLCTSLLWVSLLPLIWPLIYVIKMTTDADRVFDPTKSGDWSPSSYIVCLGCLLWSSTADFEDIYLRAWREKLLRRGAVVEVNTFVGKDGLKVPIFFDESNDAIGNDRETFEMLRMWYAWLRIKKGFSEILLPRNLAHIDKVKLCTAVQNTANLGTRIKAYELGRNGSSHVANFANPMNIDEKQRFQAADMLKDPTNEGVEFVRRWDSMAVSIVSLLPFGVSLVFAGLWIGISVRYYGADAQVAVQTAFIVAGYIVTAGALLIALLAYLDTVSQA